MESKSFFFEKRTKKLLFYKFLALRRRARQVAKSFCFFFQKEVLSSVLSVNNNADWYKGFFFEKRSKKLFSFGKALGRRSPGGGA